VIDLGKLERDYQAGLIKRIEARFPGCLVLKNDEQYIQGIPDLTVLHGRRYALLEVKKSLEDIFKQTQPNQVYYITTIVHMGGIADFICPENEVEVLDAIQRAFES